MNVPLWVWALTLVAIGVIVAVDVWQARSPHDVTFREAMKWSLIYVAAAVVFGVIVALTAGTTHATEFFAGYLVEKSLSVDNLFVFAIILGQFAVPSRHRQRILLIGVIGALVLRAAFIAVGAALIERLAFTFVIFGAFLVYTAVQLLRTHGEQHVDAGNTRIVRLLRRVIPVSDNASDGALLTRKDGRRAVTPLLVAAVAILSVDILFALDSIPAIFGITHTPYLVFTANAFALLGLRALYFLVIGFLDRLVHLHYGLAAILAFIGVKLVLHYVHSVAPSVPEIPTLWSLLAVIGILGLTTLTSLRSRRDSQASPGRVVEIVVNDHGVSAGAQQQ
ncbi:MAG: TerC/Alx family metal homeostasis membrane protein [Acidothermaceae bacterium]